MQWESQPTVNRTLCGNGTRSERSSEWAHVRNPASTQAKPLSFLRTLPLMSEPSSTLIADALQMCMNRR